MTIEDELRQLIVAKYGTLTNFGNKIGMSQSTLSTIFKRGIQKTSITRIFKICDELEISSDALAEGRIIPKEIFDSKEYTEYDYIFDQMLIDGRKLNDYERWNMKRAFHDQAERIRESRERFKPEFKYIETAKGKFAIDKKTNRKFFVASDGSFIPYKNTEFINKIIEEENKKRELEKSPDLKQSNSDNDEKEMEY